MEKQIVFEIFTKGESATDTHIYRRRMDESILVIEQGRAYAPWEIPSIDGAEVFRMLESRVQSDVPFLGTHQPETVEVKNPDTGEWVAVKGGRPLFLAKAGHDQWLANYETKVAYK